MSRVPIVSGVLLMLLAATPQLGCDDGDTGPPVDAAVTDLGTSLDGDRQDIEETDSEVVDPDAEVDGTLPDEGVEPDDGVDPDLGPDEGITPDLGLDPDRGVHPSTPGLRGRITWSSGPSGVGTFVGGAPSFSQQMTLSGRLRWLGAEAQQ